MIYTSIALGKTLRGGDSAAHCGARLAVSDTCNVYDKREDETTNIAKSVHYIPSNDSEF